MEPKLGDRDTCTACGEPIEYIGPYWRHLGERQPRHIAQPRKGDDLPHNDRDRDIVLNMRLAMLVLGDKVRTWYPMGVPLLSHDDGAIRALIRVMPPEGQARVVAVLINRLEIDPGTFGGLAALLTATPRQLRDAVLAAMEGE